MPFVLNRTAVIVTPKKKFINWVMNVEDSSEWKVTEKEIKKDPGVYLVDRAYSSDMREIRSIMERSYLDIAIEEFAAWWTDVDDWPVIKNLKEFEEFFEWNFHDMIVDISEDELYLYET